ncbi:MAG TPA: hypothetical protein VMA30_00410 [Xanthobacteraceae bacterium]|nr:hypothetical protein [Roseiarcus sp.]HUC47817.1 hypothetical protein [Xanthobacteraceae bacterium]
MSDDKILQRYPSPDGKRWVDLRQRADGLFYFQEFAAPPDSVPEYGAQTNTVPGLRSGTCKTFEAAESDLKDMTPWLCAKSK